MFGTRIFSFPLSSLLLFLAVETAFASTGEIKFLLFDSMQCSVCARIRPRIDAFRETGWPITCIDADRDVELVRRFQIQAVPTFIMLIDDREFDRFIGGPDPELMQQKIIELDKKGREYLQRNSSGQSGQPGQLDRFARSAPSAQPQFTQTPPPNAVSSPGGNHPMSRYISASVRIHVNDPTGTYKGTGTIIDTRGGEALVLTCGHIFRETQGQGLIELDLFLENGVVKVQGECVDYDSEENDLALVKFTVPQNTLIRAIPLAPQDTLQVGQTLISVGCDDGGTPTIRQHRILSLDRQSTPGHYRNPFHYIQVSGAPTFGRSGGGLFSADGYLVGVCNTGDPNSNDGHFVPLSVVRRQMDQVGPKLTAIYQSPSLSSQPDPQLAQASVQSGPGNEFVPLPAPPPEIALASLSGPVAETSAQNGEPAHSYTSLTPEERATVEEVRRRQAEGAEVILIVNPVKKGNEKVQSEIIKLENVSEKFLDVLLERESVAVRSNSSKDQHPTLTEQAAAMSRRPIAAPANNVNRQQETGLRTQRTTK